MHTWLQTTCGRSPAHHRRYSPHNGTHPRVGDAESLERCVATGVEKDVEGAQEACQGVYCQREQSDSWHSTGQSKGHCVEGADIRKGDKQRGSQLYRLYKAQVKAWEQCADNVS